MPPPGRDIQLGEQFGWLTVLAKPGHKRIYRCLCDPALGGCGTQHTVLASRLLAGTTRSCGCFRRSQLPALNTTHGLSNRPEFTVWLGVIDRCTKPHKKQWRRYGGRGITVCDHWQGPDGFPHFLADMGERPDPDYELHRTDNDGPYSPENCAWISPEEHKGIHAMARRSIYSERDSLRYALREIADSADLPNADLIAIARNALDGMH